MATLPCCAAWLIAACGETQFGGGKANKTATSPEVGAPVPTTFYSVTIPCAQSSTPALSVDATAPVGLTASGELCPEPSSEQLNVVFLIDVSFSIRTVDAQLEGTCGRLKAGKALVTHLRETVANPTKVWLSVAHFSSAATVVIERVPLTEADAVTTVETFCAAEFAKQGFTDYGVAFGTLSKLATDQDLTRLAYLISDGVPTAGGDAAPGFVDDPAESKRRLTVHGDAAKAALAAVNAGAGQKPWSLNALFVGSKDELASYGFDPATFLTELTGDPSRVAVLGRADALAAAIVALPPGVPGLDPTTARASLAPGNGTQLALGIASLAVTVSGGRWAFALEPLETAPLPAGPHELTVTAKDVTGRDVTSRGTIQSEAR